MSCRISVILCSPCAAEWSRHAVLPAHVPDPHTFQCNMLKYGMLPAVMSVLSIDSSEVAWNVASGSCCADRPCEDEHHSATLLCTFKK